MKAKDFKCWDILRDEKGVLFIVTNFNYKNQWWITLDYDGRFIQIPKKLKTDFIFVTNYLEDQATFFREFPQQVFKWDMVKQNLYWEIYENFFQGVLKRKSTILPVSSINRRLLLLTF